ncbi:hypothetical protein GJ688_13925 [Heliobacillus mobilis]|uniref:Uncharacterized protein n=1 Tax=Heliobacterium mobile TaxID=28064 RepID=A0A6I3SM81_HELMO|nr:hypothetical protein [Heliobacterium mobile]
MDGSKSEQLKLADDLEGFLNQINSQDYPIPQSVREFLEAGIRQARGQAEWYEELQESIRKQENLH